MTSRKIHAQRAYNDHFNYLRRQAKEKNLDLSLLLSEYLPIGLMPFYMPSESHRINPPDTSKMNQKDQELCLKEWYRPHYYEYLINELLWKHVDAQRLVLRERKRGGKIRGGEKTLEKIARQTLIIQKEKELIDRGIEKNLNKHIAKELHEEYGYVQKFRAAQKKEKIVATS